MKNEGIGFADDFEKSRSDTLIFDYQFSIVNSLSESFKEEYMMKNNAIFALWAGLFILCAGLGFIPEPEGVLGGLLMLLSVLFFVPPFLLLRRGNREVWALVRNLSALSLGLTLLLLVLNFLLAVRSEFLGNVLHFLLTVVSAPMIVSGYWVLSLFLWACLLMYALKLLRKK